MTSATLGRTSAFVCPVTDCGEGNIMMKPLLEGVGA